MKRWRSPTGSSCAPPAPGGSKTLLRSTDGGRATRSPRRRSRCGRKLTELLSAEVDRAFAEQENVAIA
jgi:hypothetical protein